MKLTIFFQKITCKLEFRRIIHLSVMNWWQESTLCHYEVHIIGQVPIYFHIDLLLYWIWKRGTWHLLSVAEPCKYLHMMNKKGFVAKGKGSRCLIQIKGPPMAFECDPSIMPLDPLDFTRQVFSPFITRRNSTQEAISFRSRTDRMPRYFNNSY